jgi:hypothetical protein
MKYLVMHENARGQDKTTEVESATFGHAITLAIEANQELVKFTGDTTWGYALFDETGAKHLYPVVDRCSICGSHIDLEPDGGYDDPITGHDYTTSWLCKKCGDKSEGEYQRQLIEADMKEAINDE